MGSAPTLGPGKSVGLLGLVPCLPGALSSHVGLKGIGGRKVGEEEERATGRDPPGLRIRGNVPSISPAQLGPGSLLQSQASSSTLHDQRDSWVPPAVVKPKPHHPTGPFPTLWVLSIGPARCLGPTPNSQGLFQPFFFFLLIFAILILFYLQVVVSPIFLIFLTYLLVF